MKMPERGPQDGPVTVTVLDDDRICVAVDDESLTMSRYNAVRLLGMLSVTLGFPLSKAANKVIKL